MKTKSIVRVFLILLGVFVLAASTEGKKIPRFIRKLNKYLGLPPKSNRTMDILLIRKNAVDIQTNSEEIDANFKSINKAEIINFDHYSVSCKTTKWTTDCNRGVWIEEDRVSVGANSTYGCNNWYGFGYYNQNQTEYDYYDGSISTTFSGNGHAELDFGNCYKTGIVYATLGAPLEKLIIATASKETPNVKVEFDFNDGSILRIFEMKDYGDVGGGVIQLNSLHITQCN